MNEITATEAYDLMVKILLKYDASVNEDDGGERPFNESGEAIDALMSVVRGDHTRPGRDGWLD